MNLALDSFSDHLIEAPNSGQLNQQHLPSATTASHHHHHHYMNMLGLHNILLIAPPPSSSSSDLQNINAQQYCTNLGDPNYWASKKNQDLGFVDKAVVSSVEDDASVKVCRDCGNRAKKECGYGRCRSCCKSQGYDCPTHVKSTWVPAIRRRERKTAEVGVGSGDVGGAGSSGSSSCGSKRPRAVLSSQNVTTASHSSTCNPSSSLRFDIHQDASFKESLPSQVRAPAIFRCIRVTAINDGEPEVAYQATVTISGHTFKGLLYDRGIDEKNVFPCISKLQFEDGTNATDF